MTSIFSGQQQHHWALPVSLSINTIEHKQVLEQSCHLAHLSVCLSVRQSVSLSGGWIVEKWLWLYLDAIWDGEWGRSRGGCIRWVEIVEKDGTVLGVNVGHSTITNEDFVPQSFSAVRGGYVALPKLLRHFSLNIWNYTHFAHTLEPCTISFIAKTLRLSNWWNFGNPIFHCAE